MPKDTVKPQIVTGLEALGRGQDLNKLAQFLQYLQPLGPETIASSLNVDDYIDRLGASLGIDTGGLITETNVPQKTPEQKQAEQEQMMQQQSMNKLEDTISGMAQKGALPITEKAIEQVQQQTDQGVE